MRLRSGLLGMSVLVVTLLTTLSLYSLPRLATEHSTPCVTCHVNPNGGGMRTEFGQVSVAQNELCLQIAKKYVLNANAKPRLSDNFTYGLDYRLLLIKQMGFFRMQTDLYLSAEILKKTTFNVTFNPGSMKEGYFLAKLGQDQYWFKVGRFYPAFGLRDVDHTAFVRTVPGLAPELTLDGLSVGGDFHGSNVTIEFYQIGRQSVGTFHSFRAGALGPVGFLTGVSWRQSERVESTYGISPIAKSAFGGLSYDRFSLMAEGTLVGKGNEQVAFFSQLNARVVYGITLIGEYNFHDPDQRVKGGFEEFYRFSIEFFPLPYVELRPSWTKYTEGPLKDDSDFFIQLHVNY